MGQLAIKLRSYGQVVSKIGTSEGLRQINALSQLEQDRLEGAIVTAGQELIPIVRQMLVANYYASGIKTVSGTLLRAVANSIIEVHARGIYCTLASNQNYPKGKGNVYAASASLKYGAVRQPLTKTHYVDLPTGETKALKKGKGGQLGQKAKRSLKDKVLYGIELGEKQKKAKKALESGKVSVIAPHPDFYTLNDGQYQTLQGLWVQKIAQKIRQFGVRISA